MLLVFRTHPALPTLQNSYPFVSLLPRFPQRILEIVQVLRIQFKVLMLRDLSSKNYRLPLEGGMSDCWTRLYLRDKFRLHAGGICLLGGGFWLSDTTPATHTHTPIPSIHIPCLLLFLVSALQLLGKSCKPLKYGDSKRACKFKLTRIFAHMAASCLI